MLVAAAAISSAGSAHAGPDGSSAVQIAAPPVAGQPDHAFVGHYYLSGVMETGSELLLRADGTFEWAMTYGALDQFAHGVWGRDGGAIVLVPAVAQPDRPLFALREVEPWSEAAEDELRLRAYDEADARVRERCPFADAAAGVAAAPSVPLDDTAQAPLPEALQAEAGLALQRALAARNTAETLARAALAGSPQPADAAGPEAAAEALGAWEIARWNAIDAARKAGLPAPELSPPALPETCRLATRESAASLARERWTGGMGLRVYDEASGQGARGVKATLRLADGTRTTIVTGRRGLAFMPGKLASPVVQATLTADYAPGRDQTIDIAPTVAGVVHFTIDASQLVAPPFERLRLRIEGRALIPDEMGRGRYERQP